MATKRIAQSTIDWAQFAKKIPESQRASFNAFKQKSDGYLRAVNALPEKQPKIDFSHYQNKIAVSGMVENFQKKYEGLQIPYPKDTVTEKVSHT